MKGLAFESRDGSRPTTITLSDVPNGGLRRSTVLASADPLSDPPRCYLGRDPQLITTVSRRAEAALVHSRARSCS
jgi:hypothetical protein